MRLMNFTIKDIVFMALISVVMNVVSFMTVPLVTAVPIPGIRNVVVAPFFGLLLAIALLKIKKIGTATIISFFVGVLLIFISPAILAFMLASGIVTDIVAVLLKKPFDDSKNIILLCGVYMIVEVWFGIFFGALFLSPGFSFDLFLTQPLVILVMSLASFLLGAAGGFLGSKIGGEFKRAGVAQ